MHVSASAKGRGDGSLAHPFGTLEAARDALRKLRRRGKIRSAVRVLVTPGTYRLQSPLVFTPEDSGTADCPVTWAGNGGRPLLSGARVIEGWSKGTINGQPCWQVVLPEVAAGHWWFTQIFVNGRRRLRARLPKQGFYRFAGVPEEEAKRDPGGFFHGAMSAHFVPGEIRSFHNLPDIDVVVPDHWREGHLRMASVDEATHTVRFSTKGFSRFSRDETGRHTRFRLDHVMEACTEPGDWYLDRTSGTLSYIPMPGENPVSTLVEAPTLDLLLAVQGDALDPVRRVRHLRFEFLDLRHADWELPPENPGARQSAFQVPAAVRFVGAEDCAFYGCRVSQVAGWGVEVLRGCHRTRIIACALHDLGGGGIKIGHEGGLAAGWSDSQQGDFRGMDAGALGWGPCREDPGGRMAGRDKAEPSATTVSDCSIHDGGLIFHSAIGVWIGDAGRNRVVHNHIWNFSYSGISCGWTWGFAPAFTHDNRIEGNRIHAIGHGVLSDMGAIYTLGRQAGSTIRRNYISDVHSYGYGGWGIYPDEGSSWILIEENVVCGTKCGGFHQHYGRDNIVRRNIFVDSVENQIAASRCEFVRSMTFERNLVQGAGNGFLWQGAGWASADVDRNVYAGDPSRPALFAGQDWTRWQSGGRDMKGRFIDAILLDPAGAIPASANKAALKAAGIDPRMVTAVIAEAGPRMRGVLPATIDDVPREPEKRRPIVEPLFWPWPAEWPMAASREHPWNKLPAVALAETDRPQPISLTLENRGDAQARGRYHVRVVPASAARLTGPGQLAVMLAPGERAALDTGVVATGKSRGFRVEAIAEGEGFVDTCLLFAVAPTMTIRRVSDTAGLAVLDTLPSRRVNGNGCPVKASARFAVAGDRLLVKVTSDDAIPTRGANLWDGSSIELFVAPDPGVPQVQMIAAPAYGQAPAVARLAVRGGLDDAPGAEAVSVATAKGWTLAVSVPFGLLGIKPGASLFLLDLVVNATRPGQTTAGRALLAGTTDPGNGPALYARVSVK